MARLRFIFNGNDERTKAIITIYYTEDLEDAIKDFLNNWFEIELLNAEKSRKNDLIKLVIITDKYEIAEDLHTSLKRTILKINDLDNLNLN